MRRSRFVSLAAAAALGASATPAVFADGARPGAFCLPLAKGAADEIFDFELYLLDGEGKTFRLGELLGTPVWVNFFTSWCPPCNDEAARVIDLAHRYAALGLHVVGVDVKEQPSPVRAFRDRHRVDYPIALDSTGSVFKELGFRDFPTHLFLRRDGKISCIFTGALDQRFMDNEVAVVTAQPHREAEPAPETTAAPPEAAPSAAASEPPQSSAG